MDFDTLAKSRKSVRNFKNKRVDWRDIIECIDTARFAPMAGNVFSPRFIMVHDQEKINKLAEAAQQAFISETEYVVVVCSDTKRTTLEFGKEGEVYLRQQVGAAIQNIMLALTERKLSTCWIGYFDENAIIRELKIPENVQVEALLPIGYASEAKGETRKDKNKAELNRVLFYEKFGNRKMVQPRKTDGQFPGWKFEKKDSD